MKLDYNGSLGWVLHVITSVLMKDRWGSDRRRFLELEEVRGRWREIRVMSGQGTPQCKQCQQPPGEAEEAE